MKSVFDLNVSNGVAGVAVEDVEGSGPSKEGGFEKNCCIDHNVE